jgi:hypothetical protein
MQTMWLICFPHELEQNGSVVVHLFPSCGKCEWESPTIFFVPPRVLVFFNQKFSLKNHFSCVNLTNFFYLKIFWLKFSIGSTRMKLPIFPLLIHISTMFPMVDSHLDNVPHGKFTSQQCSPWLIHISTMFPMVNSHLDNVPYGRFTNPKWNPEMTNRLTH